MHFGFVSDEQASLWAWRRLQDEGHTVYVYLPHGRGAASQIGDGYVSKVHTPAGLMQAVTKRGVIIFDGNGHAELANSLRVQGYTVLCGGRFPDKLEHDRTYGMEIAKEIGIDVPPYTEFPTISKAIEYARAHKDKSFYFKSNKYLESDATRNAKTWKGLVAYLEDIKERFGVNTACILQEKVEGTALSTAWYWNGTSIVLPLEGTIEHKKYLNDELGPSTGCQFNVVWFYRDSAKIGRLLKLDKVEEIWQREKAPPGLYDINAIITPAGKPYFLEWTPRFGYDSEPTAQLLVSNLGALYAGWVRAQLGMLPVETEAAAYGIRVTVPPYPWEFPDDRKPAGDVEGNRIPINPKASLYKDFIGYSLMLKDGEVRLADSSGVLGVVATKGVNLKDMHNYAISIARKLDVAGLGYRTDGAAVLAKDLRNLRQYLPDCGIPRL
jgi:phosphoribosylamine-glycine ligase